MQELVLLRFDLTCTQLCYRSTRQKTSCGLKKIKPLNYMDKLPWEMNEETVLMHSTNQDLILSRLSFFIRDHLFFSQLPNNLLNFYSKIYELKSTTQTATFQLSSQCQTQGEKDRNFINILSHSNIGFCVSHLQSSVFGERPETGGQSNNVVAKCLKQRKLFCCFFQLFTG